MRLGVLRRPSSARGCWPLAFHPPALAGCSTPGLAPQWAPCRPAAPRQAPLAAAAAALHVEAAGRGTACGCTAAHLGTGPFTRCKGRHQRSLRLLFSIAGLEAHKFRSVTWCAGRPRLFAAWPHPSVPPCRRANSRLRACTNGLQLTGAPGRVGARRPPTRHTLPAPPGARLGALVLLLLLLLLVVLIHRLCRAQLSSLLSRGALWRRRSVLLCVKCANAPPLPGRCLLAGACC